MIWDVHTGHGATRSPRSSQFTPLTVPNKRCTSKFGGPLRSAQDKFRRAAADVFVYGSDRAYSAERRLARLVAPELGVGAVRVRRTRAGRYGSNTERWTKAKAAAFDRAYVAFERVMCGELSAQPRRGCS
jgi:hypothetical protein